MYTRPQLIMHLFYSWRIIWIDRKSVIDRGGPVGELLQRLVLQDRDIWERCRWHASPCPAHFAITFMDTVRHGAPKLTYIRVMFNYCASKVGNARKSVHPFFLHLESMKRWYYTEQLSSRSDERCKRCGNRWWNWLCPERLPWVNDGKNICRQSQALGQKDLPIKTRKQRPYIKSRNLEQLLPPIPEAF